MPKKAKKNLDGLVQALTSPSPSKTRKIQGVPMWVEEKAFLLFGEKAKEFKYVPRVKISKEDYDAMKDFDGHLYNRNGENFYKLGRRTFVIFDGVIYYTKEEESESVEKKEVQDVGEGGN